MARDPGVDAVQVPAHPELELVSILRTHPFSQLLDRGRPSSAIFLEHFQ
jgi:hypothetical protein